MKQRLIVKRDSDGDWCVTGEGFTFYCSCYDKESALFVAHQVRNQWYPRARVILEEPTRKTLREERFRRREWSDQMWSDYNE